jgi:tetratricopeptide (TPR) repeat protein
MYKRISHPIWLQLRFKFSTALCLIVAQSFPLSAFAQNTAISNYCPALLQSDRIRVEMEPATPIPEELATDEVRLKLNALSRLVQVPISPEYGIGGQLSDWLFGTEIKSGVLGRSQLAELLPKVQPQHRQEAIATLKQVQLHLRGMSVQHNVFRNRAYRILAEAYFQLQDQENAIATLSEAADIAEVEVNLEHKIGLLLEIADTYQTIRQPELSSKIFRQAALLAERSPQSGKTFWNYNIFLVQGYIDDRQVERGLALLPRVEDWEAKNQLRLRGVRQYLQQQQLPQARQLAQQINDSGRYKASALVDVAIAYHRQKQASAAIPLFNQALRIARAPGAASTLWTTVLMPYAKGGQIDAVAQVVPTLPPNQQFNLRLMVAGEYRKQGKPAQSTATIQQMEIVLRKLRMSRYEVIEWTQQAIQNSYQPEAIAFLRGLKTLPPIPPGESRTHPRLKALAIALVARERRLIGQVDVADKLLQSAIDTAKEITLDPAVDGVTSASVLQEMSDTFLSENQIDLAWRVLQSIPPEQYNVNWEGIITASTKLGRLDIANEALQRVPSPVTYLHRMGPVARANLRQQQAQATIAILDRMATQINPTQMQSMHGSLQELVVLYGQAGAPEKGLAIVPKILDPLGRAEAENHLACYRR